MSKMGQYVVDSMEKYGYVKPLYERCGAYAEYWEEIGMPEGWLGCSLPKGHEGNHRDNTEEGRHAS